MDSTRLILRRVFYGILNRIRDPYVAPTAGRQPGFMERVGRTMRYRLAAKGFALTRNEKRLVGYKGKHKGQRCFIIGNGPSLNALDLGLLKDEFTFGVNAIYTNYENMGFYPTYYVVEDVFVAEDRAGEINRYAGSTKFFGNYFKYCLDDDENTLWLNVIFRYDDYEGFPFFSTNAARRVWTGGTVSYLCMQLAYYMGFDEVYLVGFDHSYTIPDTAVVDGVNIVSTDDDVNHFNKDYFGKGKRWHDPMLDRMELAYVEAKASYEAAGRRIVNATKGGRLEIFPRVVYEDLF